MSLPKASLCVIVPMKEPALAKTRLGDTLPAKARAALARTLFRQTLRVLRSLRADVHVLVVSNSPDIKAISASFGVPVLAEGGTSSQGRDSLNAAAAAGARYAADNAFEAVCVLPADLADPDGRDLEALFALPRPSGSMILVPAHDGGTNCLILCPPHALARHDLGFAYGRGSCAAHQRLALEAGLSCLLVPMGSLLHDVDTSADLGGALARGLYRRLGAFE